MKLIRLNTAVADNGGRYCHAGDRVTVGDGARALAAGRARVLVADGSAVDVTPPERKTARRK
jgi:hypothetical protein